MATILPQCCFQVQWIIATAKKASYIINKGCSLHGLGEDLVRNKCIPLIATEISWPDFGGNMKNSNPFMVAGMAAEIGIIHHMLTEAVLATTHHNTWHFFNLVQH